jgi:TolB protein
MVMDVDGGNVRTLTELPGFDSAAAWSPDGGTILFTTGRNAAGQFFLMDADGSDVRVIAGERLRGFEPSWE